MKTISRFCFTRQVNYKPYGKLKNTIYRVKEMPSLTDFSQLPVQLEFVPKQARTHVKELRPQVHDFIDFKKMSGNEILLNMQNSYHFRNSEIANAFNQLASRYLMPINRPISINLTRKGTQFRNSPNPCLFYG